jgi:hypothetical protein
MHFSPVKEGMFFFKEKKDTSLMTSFYAFAEARLGRPLLFEHEYVVDACLDGMEEGELDVFSKNRCYYYLWEQFMFLLDSGCVCAPYCSDRALQVLFYGPRWA